MAARSRDLDHTATDLGRTGAELDNRDNKGETVGNMRPPIGPSTPPKGPKSGGERRGWSLLVFLAIAAVIVVGGWVVLG